MGFAEEADSSEFLVDILLIVVEACELSNCAWVWSAAGMSSSIPGETGPSNVPSSFSGLEGPPGSSPISMSAFSPRPLLSNSRILPSPPLSIADLLSEPLLFRCFSTLAPAPVRRDEDGDSNVGLNAGNVVLSLSPVGSLPLVSDDSLASATFSAGMVKSIVPAVHSTILHAAIPPIRPKP